MTLRVSLKFSDGNVVPVGVLSSVGRDTAFEYDASFLSLGLNPVPFRLPAKGGVAVFDRAGGMETFGMFEDSLPDGWGRRIVDVSFRKRGSSSPRGVSTGRRTEDGFISRPLRGFSMRTSACRARNTRFSSGWRTR